MSIKYAVNYLKELRRDTYLCEIMHASQLFLSPVVDFESKHGTFQTR
jgi:hypothetical protein